MDDNAPCHRTEAAEQLRRVRILNEWIGWHNPGISIPSSMYGFSRQTLGSSYLTTSNDSGASIGAVKTNAAMPQQLS
ncbi:hypothetical protein TNCV_4015251 [Trichonephila clavipes]|nr:hypothetical protein TNCV_4015251 [Trichonephila clavipes]